MMKHKAWIGLLTACVAVCVIGCSWDTGNDADSWSDNFNWVNFSGAYRAQSGGILVTDYTTSPTIPGTTDQYPVSGEKAGSINDIATSAGGMASKKPIVEGTFSVTFKGHDGSLLLVSDKGNGALSGGGMTGIIDYDGGTWSVETEGHGASAILPGGGGNITISYSYYATTGGSAGGTTSGASGKTIYQFNVEHQGQHLTLTDNNGAVYSGKMKTMRSATGSERTDETAKWIPTNGDSIIATFNCSGTSAAGVKVEITGTFQGTVSGSVFTSRTLTGTWIEPSRTGNINGVGNSIMVTLPPAEEEATTDETVI